MPLFPTQFWHITSTEALLTHPSQHPHLSPTLLNFPSPSLVINSEPATVGSVCRASHIVAGVKKRGKSSCKTGWRTHLMLPDTSVIFLKATHSELHHACVQDLACAVCAWLRGRILMCDWGWVWRKLRGQLWQWDLSGPAGGWVLFIYPFVPCLF